MGASSTWHAGQITHGARLPGPGGSDNSPATPLHQQPLPLSPKHLSHTCTHTHTRTHTHTHTHTHTQTHRQTRMHARTYARLHTHTHTHTKYARIEPTML